MGDIPGTANVTIYDDSQTYAADVTSANRLKVDASVNLTPAEIIRYRILNLLNGSSKNMNVNGSSTPVDFSFAPASGETWYVEGLYLLIADVGTPDLYEFGALGSALTNGLQLIIKKSETENEAGNLKDNSDIGVMFMDRNSGILIGLGFFNHSDMYAGGIDFKQPILLNGTNGDKIIFRVRDNLTGLDALQTAVKVWRVV